MPSTSRVHGSQPSSRDTPTPEPTLPAVGTDGPGNRTTISRPGVSRGYGATGRGGVLPPVLTCPDARVDGGGRPAPGPGARRDRPVRPADHRRAGPATATGLAGAHRDGLAPGHFRGGHSRGRRSAAAAGRSARAGRVVAAGPAADRAGGPGARHHPARSAPPGRI